MALQFGDQQRCLRHVICPGLIRDESGPEPKSLWSEPKGLNLESLVEYQLIPN